MIDTKNQHFELEDQSRKSNIDSMNPREHENNQTAQKLKQNIKNIHYGML